MSNIKSKRSAVPGRVPSVDQLELGELALNTYDGRLFLKKNVDGVESIVTLQAAEHASFAQLIAGYGLQPATYDGTSTTTFNIDPKEIDINQIGNSTTFIQQQITVSGSTIFSAFTNGNDLGSFAVTGSNTFKGHEILSGSVLIQSSANTTFNVSLIDVAAATPTPTPTPTPTATAIGATPIPTPTPTFSGPTPTPTLTPTPTATALPPSVSLGRPYCSQNNCSNAASPCTVNYYVTVNNAPAGAYVTVLQTGGGGSVSMINTSITNAVLARYESNATESPTLFTLQLRNSGGTIIASSNNSVGHLSSVLPLCN